MSSPTSTHDWRPYVGDQTTIVINPGQGAGVLLYALRCPTCGTVGAPPQCYHGVGQSQLQVQAVAVVDRVR